MSYQNPPDPGAPGQGWPQQPGGWAPPPPTPGNAVAALVLGLVGLLVCPLVPSVAAIIVGRQATREIDRSQGKLGGRSTAQAGFILGVVGTILWALIAVLIAVIVAIGVGVSHKCEVTVDENGSISSRC